MMIHRISFFCLVSLLLSSAAFAADFDVLRKQEAHQGLADLVWEVKHAHPGANYAAAVHYPQGLGPKVDADIAARAAKTFAEIQGMFQEDIGERAEESRALISEALSKGGPLPEEAGAAGAVWFCDVTYDFFRPSGRYVSLLFHREEYTGGAHGNRHWTALSYDLTNARPLTLKDIFPDETAVNTKLLPLVAAEVQAQKDPEADKVKADPESMDLKPARMALTPEGLRVVYSPYEMGSYAEGAFMVDIPKAELLKMGANAALWQ